MQGPFPGKYGVTKTVQFVLYTADGTVLQASATIATGDVKKVIDGAAIANTTNLPVNEGGGIYSLVLTATEMTGERVTVILDDATAGETFLGTSLHVVTVGNASAQLSFDLDDATPTVNMTEVDGVSLATHESGVPPVPIAGQYLDAIWYDEVNGAAGSTLGTHGTVGNPSSSFANALTLMGSAKIRTMRVLDTSTVPLVMASAVTDKRIECVGSVKLFDFNSQDVDESVWQNCTVSGTVTTGDFLTLIDSNTNGIVNGNIYGVNSQFSGRIKPDVQLYLLGCASGVNATTTFDFLLSTTMDMSLRRWSGKIQVENMAGIGNTFDADGQGEITIDASCTAGTVNLRGSWSVTDNSAGAVTVNYAASGVNVTQISGSTIGATRLGQLLAETEFATITSQISVSQFIATGLVSTAADTYINRRGILISGTNRGATFDIVDYDGSTKTCTVDPLHFTPAVNDTFLLLA